jgi:hypothetical protein
MVWKMSKEKEAANLWKFFKSEDPALGKMGLSMAEGIVNYDGSPEELRNRLALATMADIEWGKAIEERREADWAFDKWTDIMETEFKSTYWDWIGSVLRYPWNTHRVLEAWTIGDYDKLKKAKTEEAKKGPKRRMMPPKSATDPQRYNRTTEKDIDVNFKD